MTLAAVEKVCPKDHLMTFGNTAIGLDRKRRCRTCVRAKSTTWRRANQAHIRAYRDERNARLRQETKARRAAIAAAPQTCGNCGMEFFADWLKPKCSETCAPPRECVTCHRTLTAPRTRYCPDCRPLRRRPPRQQVECVCVRCGETYMTKYEWSRYCTSACRKAVFKFRERWRGLPPEWMPLANAKREIDVELWRRTQDVRRTTSHGADAVPR